MSRREPRRAALGRRIDPVNRSEAGAASHLLHRSVVAAVGAQLAAGEVEARPGLARVPRQLSVHERLTQLLGQPLGALQQGRGKGGGGGSGGATGV